MIKIFKTPYFSRWIFFRRVWGIKNTNSVYLTFDDGPTEELTEWILKFLEKEKIKATFFCVGENAKKHPTLMTNIVRDGHGIGNHTMSHNKGINTPKKEYLESIEEASKYIESDLFRPPYGRMPVQYSKKIQKKYKIIMWTWLSYDFDLSVPISKITEKARTQIKAGDILVLHDNKKTETRIKELLPKLIKIIREKGLEFGKLDL